MFWGCFAGTCGKGPGVFWEKDWGWINESSYREHTIPVIHDWIHSHKLRGIMLDLMQDRAPGHAARGTLHDLKERRIRLVFWPAFSPDLNPIENCWNWMKEYIQDKWGLEENPGYERLRRYVEEAWDALPDDYWRELLASMPARCQAVIEANGMHTRY